MERTTEGLLKKSKDFVMPEYEENLEKFVIENIEKTENDWIKWGIEENEAKRRATRYVDYILNIMSDSVGRKRAGIPMQRIATFISDKIYDSTSPLTRLEEVMVPMMSWFEDGPDIAQAFYEMEDERLGYRGSLTKTVTPTIDKIRREHTEAINRRNKTVTSFPEGPDEI